MKRKEANLPPTATNGARMNHMVLTQKVKYRMLDEEDDEINPMETDAGATLNDEYELLEPTQRVFDKH